MEASNKDRRIQRTRRMVDEAMMSLLEEKPFNEISVTELYILLSGHAGSDFSERVFDLARSRALNIAEKRASRLSPTYESMLSYFAIAGGAAIVKRWAENGFKEK